MAISNTKRTWLHNQKRESFETVFIAVNNTSIRLTGIGVMKVKGHVLLLAKEHNK